MFHNFSRALISIIRINVYANSIISAMYVQETACLSRYFPTGILASASFIHILGAGQPFYRKGIFLFFLFKNDNGLYIRGRAICRIMNWCVFWYNSLRGQFDIDPPFLYINNIFKLSNMGFLLVLCKRLFSLFLVIVSCLHWHCSWCKILIRFSTFNTFNSHKPRIY